jgi:hypothetical protein
MRIITWGVDGTSEALPAETGPSHRGSEAVDTVMPNVRDDATNPRLPHSKR